MPHHRFSQCRFSDSDFVASRVNAPAATVAVAPAMVAAPGMVLADWQAEVYRQAYQQALVDTAPPRHRTLYCTNWN